MISSVSSSLIESKHPKSGEIERRLASLAQQWEILRQLADDREKQLADAAEAHQVIGAYTGVYNHYNFLPVQVLLYE